MNLRSKQSSRSVSRPKSKGRSSSSEASRKEKITESLKPGMDPKPPKRPMSPFHRFRLEVISEYRKEMPNRSEAAITETIADTWIQMSKDEKLRFNQEFLDEIQDYVEERDEFERKNGPIRHIKFSLDEDDPLEGMYYNSVAGEGELIKLVPENHMNERGPRKRVVSIKSAKSNEEEKQAYKQGKEGNKRVKPQSKGDYLDEPSSTAKTKKPDLPKKPQGAFFLFKRENFEKLQKKNPKASNVEIATMLAGEWIGLSPNDKKKYQDQQEKDFQRYQKELKAYEKHYGEPHNKRRSHEREPSSSGKKVRMSQYEMKVKERKGNRPQIFPGENMIGNKPRDESRRRIRTSKGASSLDYFSDDDPSRSSTKKKSAKKFNEDNSSNKKKVIIPKAKPSKS